MQDDREIHGFFLTNNFSAQMEIEKKKNSSYIYTETDTVIYNIMQECYEVSHVSFHHLFLYNNTFRNSTTLHIR